MNEYMSEKERQVFEACVINGINTQTTAKDFNGVFDIGKLEPYIKEGLPLYIRYKNCRMDNSSEFIVVCSYKNELFEIVFTQ